MEQDRRNFNTLQLSVCHSNLNLKYQLVSWIEDRCKVCMLQSWLRCSTVCTTHSITHLAGFGDSSDVRVEVRGLRVELHQQHADVVQQRLASVCIPHLGQLPQVTQLKATSLGTFEHVIKSDRSGTGERVRITTCSPCSHWESFQSLTLSPEYIWRSGWLRAAPWPASSGRVAQQFPVKRREAVRGWCSELQSAGKSSNSCFWWSIVVYLSRGSYRSGVFQFTF